MAIDRATAGRLRGADVERVGGQRRPDDLRLDQVAGPPFERVRRRLEDHDRRALSEQEAVAVPIERPRGVGRVVVTLRQGTHVAEGGERDGQQGRLGPAGDDDVTFARSDEPQRVLKGDDAARARRHLGDDRAGEPVAHAHERGGHRARQGRDRERADLAGASGGERRGPLDDLLHAAATGVDDDRGAVPPLGGPVGEVEPGMIDGLGRGRHREMDEAAHPAGHLAIHRDGRIEVLDLGRDPDVEAGRVEASDRPGAGHPFDQVGPERGRVVADRGHGPQARHDGATSRVLTRWHAWSPQSSWAPWIVSGAGASTSRPPARRGRALLPGDARRGIRSACPDPCGDDPRFHPVSMPRQGITGIAG